MKNPPIIPYHNGQKICWSLAVNLLLLLWTLLRPLTRIYKYIYINVRIIFFRVSPVLTLNFILTTFGLRHICHLQIHSYNQIIGRNSRSQHKWISWKLQRLLAKHRETWELYSMKAYCITIITWSLWLKKRHPIVIKLNSYNRVRLCKEIVS